MTIATTAPPRPAETVLQLNPVLVVRVLACSVTAIVMLGLLEGYARVTGLKLPWFFHRLTDLDGEGNLPAWFSAQQLLFAAMLILGVARASTHGWEKVRWLVLAAVFAYLSFDEAVQIHEIPAGLLQRTFRLTGPLYFGWVIVAIPAVIALGIAYFRLVWYLPVDIRRLAVTSGFLYLAGALGMELISGAWVSAHGAGGAAYVALIAVEETLEMSAITLWVFTLLRYLQRRSFEAVIAVAPETER